MRRKPTRRTFLAGSTAVGLTAFAGCTAGDDDPDGDDHDDGLDDHGDDDHDHSDEEYDTYEVWALDQGTDTIYVYEPGDEVEFDLLETIDVGALVEDEDVENVVPHMIHFNSTYEYAAVACTAGARTLVFRTDDRELVAEIETGAGSHFAGFTPDDDAIIVDVIGESSIVKVDADLDAEEFEIVDEIDLPADSVVEDAEIESANPICHSHADGYSYHTLGPGYGDAGLVIVDQAEFEVAEAFGPDEVPTNCGTMPHPSDSKFYLTAGQPSNPDEDVEGVGRYYVLDTETNEIIDSDDTGGIDAHGFWFTPDGEELWVLNRETNDGIVLDPDTDDVIDEIDAFGQAQGDEPEASDAPDIMWSSPDGEYMFVTLRGPEPVSGDPHAATGVTPGFSVLDIENREILTVVEPDPIEEYSDDDLEDDDVATPDFHGIGVRVIGEYDDAAIPNSPPF